MKKLFTLVAMAMMAFSANAQQLLAEADFTTATEFNGWNQFGDGQEGSVALQAGEGLAITVGSQTGQLWQPQIMVIPDGSFNLEEDGNYNVVVVAKFPTAGTLQINMGSWSANDQATFPVEATGDFQEVECLFEGWSVNAENAHLLFQCGDFLGTTIVKAIKVIQIGGDPSGIKEIKNNVQNNVRFNLAGQKVDDTFKGVVIMNGKKFMQK